MKNRGSFLAAIASGGVGLALANADPAVAQATPAPQTPVPSATATALPSFGTAAFAATMRGRFDAELTQDDLDAIARGIDANLKSAGALRLNAKRLPALAMPKGFGDHGLPASIALMGTPFNETCLTAIGARYQAQTSFHRRRPPLVTTLS
jgi:Asp-tRNA(Asn)/Glu-tRNA(Gln) amidotransferase A subunit family amidase